MVEVSVSILNVKDDKAIQTLYNLETSGISYFHIDVMDGKFADGCGANAAADRRYAKCPPSWVS